MLHVSALLGHHKAHKTVELVKVLSVVFSIDGAFLTRLNSNWIVPNVLHCFVSLMMAEYGRNMSLS